MSKRLEKLINNYLATEISISDENDYCGLVEVGLKSLLTISSKAVDPIINKTDSDYISKTKEEKTN